MVNTLDYKIADSGKQYREQELLHISMKKEALEAEAVRNSFNFLKSLGCEDLKLKAELKSDLTFDRGFDGSITMVWGALKGDFIEIPLTLTVKSDLFGFPPKEDITKLFVEVKEKSNIIPNDLPDIHKSVVAERNLEIASKEREHFITLAEQKTVDYLRMLKYSGVKIISESIAQLQKTDANIYNGSIKVSTRLADKYGEKEVVIPITIKNSLIQMPDTLIVQKVIAQTTSVQEQTEQTVEEEIDNNIHKIQEEVDYNEAETLKSLELGPYVANQDKPAISKEAGNQSTKITDLATVLTVNKASLPESTKAGDIIDLDGTKYIVESGSQGQISTEGSGLVWTLRIADADKKVDVVIK